MNINKELLHQLAVEIWETYARQGEVPTKLMDIAVSFGLFETHIVTKKDIDDSGLLGWGYDDIGTVFYEVPKMEEMVKQIESKAIPKEDKLRDIENHACFS